MALEAPLLSPARSSPFSFAPARPSTPSVDHATLGSPLDALSSHLPSADAPAPILFSSSRQSFSSSPAQDPRGLLRLSPATSAATETTKIEEDTLQAPEPGQAPDGDPCYRSEPLMLATDIAENSRQPSSEEAVSVIHAPQSFASWTSADLSPPQSQQSGLVSSKSISDTRGASAIIMAAPIKSSSERPTRPSLSTDVKPVKYSLDSATPRAQALHNMLEGDTGWRSSSTSSLEKIDEHAESERKELTTSSTPQPLSSRKEEENVSLRAALQECWTLCNTLADLSSNHRARLFSDSGTPDAHEKAWKACWKLCQRLYAYQEERCGTASSRSVRTNVGLCRDFCQALFEVRQRRDEMADSVLRVSFELNNHLFSVQESLEVPEPFRERTFDFYITICHRLMKQRSELAEEHDQLLGACWNLAEMLFSLRQSQSEAQGADDELLGSAVQACWDLCDIFRYGWARIRPDRNTPQPSQGGFLGQPPVARSGPDGIPSSRSPLYVARPGHHDGGGQEQEQHEQAPVPETPVTEFEDTPVSPESQSPPEPMIKALGPAMRGGAGTSVEWNGPVSRLSSYSRSSNRTSSTATTTTAAAAAAAVEDVHMSRCKILVLRASMDLGFDRDRVDGAERGSLALHKFVQGLPTTSFGTEPGQATLAQQYKASILMDALLPRNQALPARGKTVSALDMATSVHAISSSSPGYSYFCDLFAFVFHFPVDQAELRRNVSIVV